MRVALKILFATVALCTMATPTAAPVGRQTRLYVMGSDLLFTSVNRNDAIASIRAWVSTIGKRLGFEFDLKLEVFESGDEVLTRLHENSVDLLMLDTPDYLRLAGSGLVEAVAIGSHDGKPGQYRYLLLVREQSGIRDLPGLRGKNVLVASRTKSGIGLAWLETHLAAGRLGRAAEFFGTLAETNRPSGCALPVFFGRLDACVVDEGNFEVLKEMNPQLGHLKVLAQSEPVVEGLVAMATKRHPHRDELVDAILGLHRDPAGAQLTMLFKTGPLTRATTEHFETAKSLWSRYEKLGRPRRPAQAAEPAPVRTKGAPQ